MTGIGKTLAQQAIEQSIVEEAEERARSSQPRTLAQQAIDETAKELRPSPSLDEETIEAVAQWHEARAVECEKIAACNADNDLGPDSLTHAADHRVNAMEIRSLLKSTPNQQVGRDERTIEVSREIASRIIDTYEIKKNSRETDIDLISAMVRGVCRFYELGWDAPAVSGEGWSDEHSIQSAIDCAPKPLKRLGERLADILDADHWNEIEPLLLALAAGGEGDGWIDAAAREITLIARDTWRDGDDLARLIFQIIARHAAVPDRAALAYGVADMAIADRNRLAAERDIYERCLNSIIAARGKDAEARAQSALAQGERARVSVSGEGWMRDAIAKSFAESFTDLHHENGEPNEQAILLATIAARHFPSPEGGGQ